MHRVKRAIIMAAGTGTRMRPVTLATPKPLVSVNGRRMIDTVIDALHQNGIMEIYVVVGYLGDQFRSLTQEHPELTIIENPWYDICNNISSLYAAREHLEESVILDGDQMVYDPAILSPKFERSCYCAVYTEGSTEEWLLTEEDGIVTHCSRNGGTRGWELHSVSFWSKEDGARLRRHLEQDFPEKKDLYWDDVALFCHPEDYRLGIRPISPDALLEIDSLEELIRIDPTYKSIRQEAKP